MYTFVNTVPHSYLYIHVLITCKFVNHFVVYCNVLYCRHVKFCTLSTSAAVCSVYGRPSPVPLTYLSSNHAGCTVSRFIVSTNRDRFLHDSCPSMSVPLRRHTDGFCHIPADSVSVRNFDLRFPIPSYVWSLLLSRGFQPHAFSVALTTAGCLWCWYRLQLLAVSYVQ